MPVYQVTDPSTGRRLRLTGDSPPTDQELEDIFSNQKSEYIPSLKDVDKAPSGFIKGARDPIDALAQMLYNVIPDSVKESGDKLNNWVAENFGIFDKIPEGGLNQMLSEQEAAYQEKRKQEGDEGFDWDRIGGNVVSTALLPGSAMAKATSLPAKMGVSAGYGAGYGALTPVTDDDADFWAEKAKQGATGAVTGAAFPVVGAGLKKAGEFIEPFIPGERFIKHGVSDYLRSQAGTDKEKIIKALSEAKEIVPGNKPTSGQAIAQGQVSGQRFGGQIAKLEKELAGTGSPNAGSRLQSRYASQEAGRRGVLDALSGTDDQMGAAKAFRAETQPLYDIAEKSEEIVNVKPVMKVIDSIIKRKANEKDVTTPLQYIKDRIEEGVSVREMSSLSKGIKKMANEKGQDGQHIYNLTQIDKVKKALDKQIGKSESAYKLAQKHYAKRSEPINQMNVGRTLRDKLVSPTDKERSTVFMNALRDAPKTIKDSTGFKRFESLTQILTPEQMKGVQNVADDLVNSENFKKIASEVKEPILNQMEAVHLRLPRLMSRPVVIANHILSVIGKDRSPEYQKILVDILENPDNLRKVLEGGDAKAKIASHILKELGTIGAVNVGVKELEAENGL